MRNGETRPIPLPGWAVVDLFCGAGGLSHGLRRAGFHVAAGVDADETCRYAFEKNNEARFVGNPLEEVTAGEIVKMFPAGSRRVLVGCAPCTPFSAYASGSGGRGDKWSLLGLFLSFQLGKAIPNFLYGECATLTSDVIDTSGYVFKDGAFSVPDTPGLGLELNQRVYDEQYAGREAWVVE